MNAALDTTQQQNNSSFFNLLKATIVGGLLFLLPLILVVLLLGHAMKLAAKVAHPVAQAAGLDTALGPAGEDALAVVMLLVIAIAAGVIAGTSLGKTLLRWAENSFLGGLPQYRMMKTMAEGFAQIETADGATPALVNVEDGWQLGYRLEQLPNGWVAVFIPQSPTPMSGTIMYLPAQRVRPLDIPMMEAMGVVKSMGAGSAKALRHADLALPRST
jgi:uncharacterized membrane protein